MRAGDSRAAGVGGTEGRSFLQVKGIYCLSNKQPPSTGSFSYHASPSTGFPWAAMFSMTHPSPGVTVLRCGMLALGGHGSYNVDAGTLSR